ncbi:MAG: glycerate kinase [Nitriliruptoraceae bacterium]
MRVLVVSDRFDAAVTSPVAAEAVAAGWRRARPDDEVSTLPLSSGGAGLCEVLHHDGDRWLAVEVVGPHGRPVEARALVRRDGLGVLEAAAACHAEPTGYDPRAATTFGVGQLLRAVLDAGADRVVVGLGDCPALDAGLGALTGFGYRLRVADGFGLKIGGNEIHRLARIEDGWAPAVSGVDIELLTETSSTLVEAADLLARDHPELAAELPQWRSRLAEVALVLERDLARTAGVTSEPGTGCAGGLGAALRAALDAELVPGAARVAGLLGATAALDAADVVVVAQDALAGSTSPRTVLGAVLQAAGPRSGTPTLAVVRHLVERERAGVVGVAGIAEVTSDLALGDGLAGAATRLAARR